MMIKPIMSASDDLAAAKAINTSKSEEDDETEKSENDATSTSADQAKEKFLCDLCDFESNWENGRSVHMTRMHKKIEQLDGGDPVSDGIDENDKYKKTSHYWEKGELGTIFQTYLDVNHILENSDLTEVSKDQEKAKVLAARKEAFVKDFKLFPPWSL